MPFAARHRQPAQLRRTRLHNREAAKRRLRVAALALFAALAAFVFAPPRGRALVSAARAESPARVLPAGEAAGPYDSRPGHLWDRLYRHFYVRTTPRGAAFGYDSLDPLLWPETKHLRSGLSYKQAVSLLDEFLNERGERLVTDTLKRAMLQRDLWAIFDWLAAGPQSTDLRLELQPRLALAIRRLALSREQIAALPDNYARAVATRAFSPEYNANRRETAFLPPDLFEPKGTWVCLGNDKGTSVASMHTQFFGGRSTFLVMLRLPGGRAATLAYLKTLREFPQPWLTEDGDVMANPNLPQFPPGTQLALVRRLMLVDEGGELTPSPLTESVQLRVYRTASGGAEASTRRWREAQDVYKFALRREKLFAGEAGGLAPLAPDLKEFALFLSQGVDWFEAGGDAAPESFQEVTLESCATCHAAAGVHSMMSFSLPRFNGAVSPPRLGEALPAHETGFAANWKLRQYEWGLLQGLWHAPLPESSRRAER
jgi:hypothetical protein